MLQTRSTLSFLAHSPFTMSGDSLIAAQSVNEPDLVPEQSDTYVRANCFISGFLVRPRKDSEVPVCDIVYIYRGIASCITVTLHSLPTDPP